jgi:hypothetical protein
VKARISKGEIHLFTYKEGLLSKVAHDLRLTVKRFRVVIDGSTVSADFFPETIQVDGAINGDVLDERALSAKDKEKIRSTMAGTVLRVSQHAKISFAGTVRPQNGGFIARGALTLIGKSHDIVVPIERDGADLVGNVEFQPSQWGIKPYSALGGAIRLQDRLVVSFRVPAPEGA